MFVWNYRLDKQPIDAILGDALNNEKRALRIIIDCYKAPSSYDVSNKNHNHINYAAVEWYAEYLSNEYRHLIAHNYSCITYQSTRQHQ